MIPQVERALSAAATELEGGWAAPERARAGSGADYFVTRVQPVPGLPGHQEGHEILTRAAASGLVHRAQLAALLRGVIRPDRGGVSYWNFPVAALHSADPKEQKRHALRQTPGTSTRRALAEIRGHLAALYAHAMAAPMQQTTFEWIGEALHLIQDSYSQAHIARAYGAGSGGGHPIRYIRSFSFSLVPPRRTRGPKEHNFPTDDRDTIYVPSGGHKGTLKPEAVLARRASREFLHLALAHLARPGDPRNAVELRGFLDKHFSM